MLVVKSFKLSTWPLVGHGAHTHTHTHTHTHIHTQYHNTNFYVLSSVSNLSTKACIANLSDIFYSPSHNNAILSNTHLWLTGLKAPTN